MATQTIKTKQYELASVKGNRKILATLAEAKQAARKMQAELQAAWGVDVYDGERKLYTAE